MFAHILMPTDGSRHSEAAILKGMRFAKEANATVTGICVVAEFHPMTVETMAFSDTKEAYLADARARADRYLAAMQKAAAEERVPFSPVVEVSDRPYEVIAKTAESKGCDLILMASHGRAGMQGLLLGSVTQKVLSHSKIPVLVYR
jgi:nucleotide-binding universal stress UspA family protein